MTIRDAQQLRDDALGIWKAGVAAVDSAKLVRAAVQVEENSLRIAGHEFAKTQVDRIIVIGGGKAGAGMAAGFEGALREGDWLSRVEGLLNVPADCVRDLDRIRLHPARPAGINEPTENGIAGVSEMRALIETATANDLVVVLLSGGGSALLPDPADGLSLDEKLAVTRLLASRGAAIKELNTVRQHLSNIKGGGLARAIRAAGVSHAVCLVISDIIGDPLDLIASGPTIPPQTTRDEAIAILEAYSEYAAEVPKSVWNTLRHSEGTPRDEIPTVVIGNNHTAVEAAAEEARRLGYGVHLEPAMYSGEAAEVGTRFLRDARALGQHSEAQCLIAGGEPTVALAKTDQPQIGGRNQELALAALAAADELDGLAILAGGTDGEDGPTDAAGAIADAISLAKANRMGLVPDDFLRTHNSYPFFDQTGGLIRTGPTHTNVMDLCVVVTAGRDA